MKNIIVGISILCITSCSFNKTKKEYYANGKIKTEATYNKEGKKEGLCIEYYEDGVKKAEIPYNNGMREGELKVYYKSGNIKSKHDFKEDKEEGKFFLFYENGEIKKEGFYVNGKTEGESRSYYATGQLYTLSNRANGNVFGQTTVYYEDGSIRGYFLNNPNGEIVFKLEYKESGDFKAVSGNGLMGIASKKTFVSTEPFIMYFYYISDKRIRNELDIIILNEDSIEVEVTKELTNKDVSPYKYTKRIDSVGDYTLRAVLKQTYHNDSTIEYETELIFSIE